MKNIIFLILSLLFLNTQLYPMRQLLKDRPTQVYFHEGKKLDEDCSFHSDYRVAKQLYLKKECKICGNLNRGDHSSCTKIMHEISADFSTFCKVILNSVQSMYPNFSYDNFQKILDRKIKIGTHPHTLKSMHETHGLEQAKAHYETLAKNTLINYLRSKKKFMDDQLVPGDIDYDTIYVALARKRHVLTLAIEMLEKKLPYTIWYQSNEEFLKVASAVDQEKTRIHYTLSAD